MNPTLSGKRLAVAIGAAVVLAGGVAGGAMALAADRDDENDRPIPRSDLERAERAALAETGGGRVTGTEAGDEESRYEVEVTLEDGTQVDVQLDEDFEVVGSETDGPDDESGPDDD